VDRGNDKRGGIINIHGGWKGTQTHVQFKL